MHFQTVIMNVADLERSIEFYGEVFGFSVLSRRDQIVAIRTPDSELPQIIILRAYGTSGRVTGGRHVGIRALILEADSLNELEQIGDRLETRGALLSRPHGDDWTAVAGHDPDRNAVVTTCSLEGGPLTYDHWTTLSEVIYGVGE